jgi:hypothetical protein
MKKNPKVADYVASFPEADRRTARQWLWNAIHRGSHVELTHGE